MLHDGKETKFDEKKYRKEMERLEAEKAQKEELINSFKVFAQDLEVKFQEDAMTREQDKELRKMFPDGNARQILNFVKTGKAKKHAPPGELNPKERELLKNVVDLDPFSGLDKKRIKEIIKEDDEEEVYDFEKDNIGLSREDFERLVAERHSRADMEKDKQKLQNRINQLNDHMGFLEQQLNNLEEEHQSAITS